MRAFLRRISILLLTLCLLSFSALADPGEDYTSYETFIGRYAGNLDFINENAGRHLINLIFASGDTEGKTRVYRIDGEVLSAKMYTMTSKKRIVGLVVTLTAPEGMSGNTSLQEDFTTSGYQCYALLMAMHDAEEPSERFGLINELNNGLRDQEKYTTFVGPYTLTARRKDNAVEFTFASVYWSDPNVLTTEVETGDSEEEDPSESEEDTEEGSPLDQVFEEEPSDEEDSLAG